MFGKWICLVTIIITDISFSCGFVNVYPEVRSNSIEGDVGEPLILTPHISAGEIKLARDQAFVKPLIKNIPSYSGFFTVDKQYNSNLFFWFFPAENNSETAPVVLWLQGGPGTPSLSGLFSESGPFYITEEQILESRHNTWTSTHNVIYMDNPVGTGYSFTDDDKGYSRNEKDVGNNLYKAMIQFYQMFPEYQKNEFFITGESYAGKYVTALAYTIHTNNPDAKFKINLQGLAIGSGWIDPEHIMVYSDYLYQIGLIDANGKDVIKKTENEIISYIQKGKWIEAFDTLEQLLVTPSPKLNVEFSLLTNLTGYSFQSNFLFPSRDNYIKFGDLSDFVQTQQFRKALRLGNSAFHNETIAFKMLKAELMQSIKPWVEVLLENYRVLMFNGQLDMIVPYPAAEAFYLALNWSGSIVYKTAERKKWYINGTLAGYTKTAKNFTEVLVRNAGHLVPRDQPLWALDLITRFTHNVPF